ncbi:MAG: peptidylprolyl isomerase [Bacteroidetes bacterium]|nr:peptidylprolyl isomerase [Bacteroidota bacterium]
MRIQILFVGVVTFVLLLTFGCRERKVIHATLETTKGNIELELYPTDAPKAVENFVGLAEQGYYNGVLFHRICKGFVIQTGDSTGLGTGGRSIYGKEFEDELNPNAPSFREGYRRGTVAMANRGPNTNTSQFFILVQDAPWMPKQYTIFGKVIKGMEVVDAIEAVDIIPEMGENDGRPVEDIVIQKVTIHR